MNFRIGESCYLSIWKSGENISGYLRATVVCLSTHHIDVSLRNQAIIRVPREENNEGEISFKLGYKEGIR